MCTGIWLSTKARDRQDTNAAMVYCVLVKVIKMMIHLARREKRKQYMSVIQHTYTYTVLLYRILFNQ